MTSPTTSADAVRVLTELVCRFEATIPTPMNFRGESTMRIEHFVDLVHEARQAITILTHHAEAGAVAVVCLVTEKRYPHFAEAQIQLYNGYEPEIGDRLFLHPAQPASQQGEEWMQRIGPADHVAVIAETKYGPGIWFNTDAAMGRFMEWPFRSNPHPTGDKVRMVIDRLFAGLTARHMNRHEVEEAFAALDQEKNDGR